MATELSDDRGVQVRLDGPVQRMISLAPHLTELVFAAGAGNRLVGVVRGSDFPPEARSVQEIGDASGIDFERVTALQPDLVLAWGSGNRMSDVARLERLGFRVLVLEPRLLEDIPRHLQMIGELLDTQDRAEAAARAFRFRTDALRDRYRGGTMLRVLFEVWHKPLMTVGGAHMISDVLKLCGARNVFADLPQLAGVVSLEQVLTADPDVIVVGSEAEEAGVKGWQRHPSLRAVRSGRVFSVPADLISRQTPRILDAAEKICADIDSARKGH